MLVVDRGGQPASLDGLGTRERLDRARRAEHVPGHALGGRHRQAPGVLAKDVLDGRRLEAVVVWRRGAVRVDVAHVGRLQPAVARRISQCRAHDFSRARALVLGLDHVERVVAAAVADHLAVHVRPAAQRV